MPVQILELEQKHQGLESFASEHSETAELMQQTIAELGATIEATQGRLDELQQELSDKMV